MTESSPYIGREQTLVKHFILQKYLERFAHIVGSAFEVITYVDCFSGPWNVQSEELRDSSFSIAIEELRKAQKTLLERGKATKLRCFFMEKDRDAFAKLREFASQVSDVDVAVKNCELENSVSDIVQFVKSGGRKSFPFVFIDPTGWTGFGMNSITPLLSLKPCEVLINFMTGHIRRFIDSPNEQTKESFESLFGSGDYRERIVGLAGQDREDEVVRLYIQNVKRTGNFEFACSAIVLHPEIDRTHFHLIYVTRNAKGVEVFKEVEKKAMTLMEQSRADAQQRTRIKRSGARELFPSEYSHDPTHYEGLRDRYVEQARSRIQTMLESKSHLLYDDAWITALGYPLVWESDLKDWIATWEKSGKIRIEGKEEKQRVPKREKNNFIVWIVKSES
ncbi:MAG: three-Cys-motif partner protein TcmP [Schlesneria sp.]